MIRRFVSAIGRVTRGTARAIWARPKVFLGVTLGVLVLDLFLPAVLLSLSRKPWDYFAFNPWLKKLPGYLSSSEVSLQQKLQFLPNLAVFWFSANDPNGFVEWGFAVDVSDLVRFAVMAPLFGAYFALWLFRRDQLAGCGVGVQRVSRNGGVAGALGSVLGLSTGPCSVAGCGAPVLPVVGLVFAGLSSGTLKFLTQLSKVSTAVVLLALVLGVMYLAWRVSAESDARHPSPS